MFRLNLALLAIPPEDWLFAGFVILILFLLALDLGVLQKRAHVPTMRESLAWTAGWITLALLFSGVVYLLYNAQVAGLGQAVPVFGAPGKTETITGGQALRLYLTGYLIEESLSIDNLFVISMIFTSLAIPVAYQHRVLFWGILSAMVMRGVMIAAGAAVVTRFSWISYVFGALLIFSALKMALSGQDEHNIAGGRMMRLIARILPVSKEFHGQRLTTRIDGRWFVTPLMVALIIIELTDVLFAIDSIPAVFAITSDPFIVFTSNIMAILGLRSLYFCLASAINHFRFLKAAIIAVLLFIGVKMCLVHTAYKISPEIAMSVVLALLLSGIAASVLVRIGSVDTPQAEGIMPDVAPAKVGFRALPRLCLSIWRANRTLRRVVVLTTGSIVLLIGLIISPLPGPGLSILGPLGIAILASEFVWARRLASHAIRHEGRFRKVVDRVVVRLSRLYIVPVVVLAFLLAWLLSEHSGLPAWSIWVLLIPMATPLCYVIYRWHVARAVRRAGLSHSNAGTADPTDSSPRT